MRTHLVFQSAELMDVSDEDLDTIPVGRPVANLLAKGLSAHGFEPLDIFQEDWGWCITLKNAGFPLWVGCGHSGEHHDGHLCFIQPSKPYIRRWFRKISTIETVERLATALEAILTDHPSVNGLRWWDESEI